MFNQILAIDIADRIPNFLVKIEPYAILETINLKSDDAVNHSENLAKVDAILVSIYQSLPESLLKKMPNVRHIFVLGTSMKKVALEYCWQQGIKVINVTEYCDHETAEWVMMHILRHFRERALPRSVLHKKLGVVGIGSVGKIVINLAQAFQMEGFYDAIHSSPELDNQNIKHVSKSEMFATCDVVSAHTPPNIAWLTKDILIHAKPNLLLINTCMGRISLDNDLEDILAERQDITLIMDTIAGAHYQNQKDRAQIFNKPAFSTIESQARLIDRFFGNIKNAA